MQLDECAIESCKTRNQIYWAEINKKKFFYFKRRHEKKSIFGIKYQKFVTDFTAKS